MTSRTIDTEGIAALLGLTRQHLTDRLTTRRWREADVLAWAKGKRRADST